ncbi:MAG: dihydrodipicolinate reductase C-terminal domain-containing protein [Terriglobales bacterium]|jgi:4-hydroxy-tetrahydrodipicolinate reductase
MGNNDVNLLVLGKGKMGSLVMELARERGHWVETHDEFDNPHARMLTPERLREIDVVADFTWPDAVLENIAACTRAGTNILVGTTGWYDKLAEVRAQVQTSGIGFLYGANFSIGVNLFFEIARAAAPALKLGFTGRIRETHHIHKKDAPSGTASKLQAEIAAASGASVSIESVREGEVVGIHEVQLDSPTETITLSHSAKSRVAFAEGAIRGAEWLRGNRGFYDFKDVFGEV